MFSSKRNFSTKLFFTNLLIMIISLISILFYFYFYLKNKEEIQFKQTLQTLSIKIAEQTDTLIYNADKIALQIASNPYILSQFYNLPLDNLNNYFEINHFLRFEICNFLNSYNFKNDLASRICLYDDSNNFVQAGYKLSDDLAIKYFFKSNDFKEIFDFFKYDSTKSLFIPPREDPFTLTPLYGEKMCVFSVVRPIKNYTIVNSEIYGYVEIQLDYKALDQLFSTLDDSINCFIVNDLNQVIYPFPSEYNYFIKNTFKETDYLITTTFLNEANYQVILMQNKNVLFTNYKKLQCLVVFIFIIIFLISTTSQLLLIIYFTRPLIKLQKSIETIRLDNLSLNLLDDPIGDEFAQLNTAFNKMIEHLNKSIENTILAKTSELKSHLFALQAQINPHFIHNTLSVMSVIAEENEVPKLENMCSKLSSMLRFSSSYKKTHCTLEEELFYTQAYLDLMQERYENMFTFDIKTHCNSNNIIVPKLIVQPLTENCFNHGFKNKPIPWHISIDSYIKNNYWFISVSDNGSGFIPEFLDDFNKNIIQLDVSNASNELMKLQIGGLCLINIYLRLKILYKDTLIFKLENNALGGATIILGGLINND